MDKVQVLIKSIKDKQIFLKDRFPMNSFLKIIAGILLVLIIVLCQVFYMRIHVAREFQEIRDTFKAELDDYLLSKIKPNSANGGLTGDILREFGKETILRRRKRHNYFYFGSNSNSKGECEKCNCNSTQELPGSKGAPKNGSGYYPTKILRERRAGLSSINTRRKWCERGTRTDGTTK
ncbi:hypothetical protein Trydic_g11603 [Trypoxylus dichotomus]